ncbi:MAG TPA: hypothetical protein VGY56_10580 [Verrucomicrobiae bacterium]|nr:hypothetical protein [Verrucomicrobiae bacterium]
MKIKILKTKTREQQYAHALFETLSSNGAILNGHDRRVIKHAFEKHFRELHTKFTTAGAAILDPRRA